MRAGRLRKKAYIQRATKAIDASGSYTPTWSTIATRQIDMMPVSAKQSLQSGQPLGEVSHKIRLRYDSAIADLTTADRLVVGSRVIEIVGVRNVEERNREYELMAREVPA